MQIIICSVVTQKHCIIVCNSPAYQLPSQESFNYADLLPEQLALKLVEVRKLKYTSLCVPAELLAKNDIISHREACIL